MMERELLHQQNLLPHKLSSKLFQSFCSSPL
jgi:hypothetical protein